MGSGSVVTISVDPKRASRTRRRNSPFDEQAAEAEYQKSLAAEANRAQAGVYGDPFPARLPTRELTRP